MGVNKNDEYKEYPPRFINHFNDSSNFNINNIPKEILNKFPDFSTNPISYKNRLGRNEKIYAGVKSDKNISDIRSWALDEETAVTFSEKHNNGKIIELTCDEFFNNFQYFVSMDVIYDYILKKGLYNEKLNRYYSESEIVILKKIIDDSETNQETLFQIYQKYGFSVYRTTDDEYNIFMYKLL